MELDFLKSAKQKDEMGVLVNTLEKYAAVLCRSLPRQLLQRILPHGVDINTCRRIGLKGDDPFKSISSITTGQ
jgi:hypothetical protein